MSKPVYKKYKKLNRDGMSTVLPTEAEKRHKSYRCVRRIMKQYAKKNFPGMKVPAKDNPVMLDWANTQRHEREKAKVDKLKYYKAGNKHLNELRGYHVIQPPKKTWIQNGSMTVEYN